MVRLYKRKVGSKPYRNYSDKSLEDCLKAINDGMAISSASDTYKIPRRTIYYHIRAGTGTDEPNYEVRPPGGQQIFTKTEEELFTNHILFLAECRCPVTRLDLRVIVKSYLLKQGRRVPIFKDEVFPGLDWCLSFEKRNPRLTFRNVQNIKSDRAAVSEQDLREYAEHLKETIGNTPASHIFNFDETNLTDDPKAKKALVRRGVKYPEIVCNATKASTSIMFCGSAAGELLAPYVVYKAGLIWDTWVVGGPAKTRYNTTPSGWFDERVFQDWFETTFLRAVRNKPGTKILIGDNVSFHCSPAVAQLCRENDIKLVFLPPNSTNITQPLDVAVFHPVKVAWRRILGDWKVTARGRQHKVLPKQTFPTLLKVLWDEISINISDNLKAGFTKCGIIPNVNVEKMLTQLPSYNAKNSENHVNESFKEFVLERTQILANNEPLRARRRRTRIVPGRSVGASESEEEVDDPGNPNEHIDDPGVSTEHVDNHGIPLENVDASPVSTEPVQMEEVPLSTSTPKIKRTQKPKKCEIPPGKPIGRRNISKPTEEPKKCEPPPEIPLDRKDISKNQFVVVKYERFLKTKKKVSVIFYVGQVVEKYSNKFKIKFLVGYKGSSCKFVFPNVDDYDHVGLSRIVKILPTPEIHRGVHNFGQMCI